jgi:hypothetical protein
MLVLRDLIFHPCLCRQITRGVLHGEWFLFNAVDALDREANGVVAFRRPIDRRPSRTVTLGGD